MSERTNQTVEIAIRFFVTANPDEDWTVILPYLQGSLNNSKNQSSGMAPIEILYGSLARDTLNLLHTLDVPREGFSHLRLMKREEAEDAMAFANAAIQEYK